MLQGVGPLRLAEFGALEQVPVEAHGGQGSLELVTHPADEQPLALVLLGQIGNSVLHRLRHPIEAAAQVADLVPARDGHPLVVGPGGDLTRGGGEAGEGSGALLHRQEQEPHPQNDARRAHQQEQPGEPGHGVVDLRDVPDQAHIEGVGLDPFETRHDQQLSPVHLALVDGCSGVLPVRHGVEAGVHGHGGAKELAPPHEHPLLVGELREAVADQALPGGVAVLGHRVVPGHGGEGGGQGALLVLRLILGQGQDGLSRIQQQRAGADQQHQQQDAPGQQAYLVSQLHLTDPQVYIPASARS